MSIYLKNRCLLLIVGVLGVSYLYSQQCNEINPLNTTYLEKEIDQVRIQKFVIYKKIYLVRLVF